MSTHKWQPAVAARGDLRLVRVDVDPGVSGRAAAAVTGHHLLVGPSDGLSVDELDRRQRLGLFPGY